MPKRSTRANKNLYLQTREEKSLSREEASARMATLSPEKIERIENERMIPSPEDIVEMADGYGRPGLCNYFCANQCAIGQKYVPEIQSQELAPIILEMVAALNSVHQKRDRLIEISADGRIDDSEIRDFIEIRDQLERISRTVSALQLWTEQMLRDNRIDKDRYNAIKEAMKK